MKYLLVNKNDEIVWSVDMSSDVGINGAKTYFQGVKQMPNRKDFDRLWKVITQEDYDRTYEATIRKPSSQGYDWWIEDKEIADDEIQIFEKRDGRN